MAALLYLGVHLAIDAPRVVRGPEISLAPSSLPLYAALSTARMAGAYVLSVFFTLLYGYAAARRRTAEKVLLPLLDVLQSVPILSFLPVVLLGLSAVLPVGAAAEVASVVLIFTSQAWNLTFAWYQALTTCPKELGEACRIFRFNNWLVFRRLELPFAAISLVWNSMMSWAGGWFFLMAAEIFTVGQRDFRLPGLGSYLQAAANAGDVRAVAWGIAALVAVVVLLDQLVWRPLLAWSERFKLEMVEAEGGASSWAYEALESSHLAAAARRRVAEPLLEAVDRWSLKHLSRVPGAGGREGRHRGVSVAVMVVAGLGVAYGGVRALHMLTRVDAAKWAGIAAGLGATLLRVLVALVIALAWTLPVGVLIGTRRRVADWLQPLVQIAASIPATALFPVLVLVLIRLPGGLSLAAILLMLLGTQWYLLFNVIAGAAAIPQDLRYTAALLGLSRAQRWRTLVLPSLLPYLITGAITAGGGAWNASIVAEYIHFGGKTESTVGIGATIADATARGDYPLLLGATLAMIVTVVAINRFVWRRLYRMAEERFRME